jgi:hypothetical protein
MKNPSLKSFTLAATIALTLLGVGCKKESAAPIASATPTPSPTPSGPTDTRIVPVSGGDAIIELWDKYLGAWLKWKFTGDQTNAEAKQSGRMVTLKWKATAAGEGPAIERIYAGSGVVLGP